MENVNWIPFKGFVVAKKLSIQYLEEDNSYTLYAIDGSLGMSCHLQKDNGVDHLDFETNFKSKGNKDIQTLVTTQNEKDDKTIQIISFKSISDNDGYISTSLRVPGTFNGINGRFIDGGTAFFGTHTNGDKIISIDVIDRDNVLGYGVDVVLSSFHDDEAEIENKGWYIGPSGLIKVPKIGGYGFVLSGLYFRVRAQKGTPSVDTLYINISWAKPSN
jgi:hypothetical protein